MGTAAILHPHGAIRPYCQQGRMHAKSHPGRGRYADYAMMLAFFTCGDRDLAMSWRCLEKTQGGND